VFDNVSGDNPLKFGVRKRQVLPAPLDEGGVPLPLRIEQSFAALVDADQPVDARDDV
jgi:hypothetical protein